MSEYEISEEAERAMILNALLDNPNKQPEELTGMDLFRPMFNELRHRVEIALGQGTRELIMPIEGMTALLDALEAIVERLDEVDAW